MRGIGSTRSLFARGWFPRCTVFGVCQCFVCSFFSNDSVFHTSKVFVFGSRFSWQISFTAVFFWVISGWCLPRTFNFIQLILVDWIIKEMIQHTHEKHVGYPFSHNHGSGKWLFLKGNYYWRDPFSTSMTMGERVESGRVFRFAWNWLVFVANFATSQVMGQAIPV